MHINAAGPFTPADEQSSKDMRPYEAMPVPSLELFSTATCTSDDLQRLASAYDSSILIFNDFGTLAADMPESFLKSFAAIKEYAQCDGAFASQVSLIGGSAGFAGNRLVASPTGNLARDYDDVRRYAEATVKAVKRLVQSKARSPLVIVQAPPHSLSDSPDLPDERKGQYSKYLEVVLLALLAETFEPLETRESVPERVMDSLVSKIAVVALDKSITPASAKTMLAFVTAVDEGRRLAKDIGGSDPERMAALRAAECIQTYFSTMPTVKVSTVTCPKELQREYPLLAAVGRASLHVPRHAPCVVRLEYRSPDQSKVQENLFMVGKGITYDTGGADVKYGGTMAGMSRDKCGAAALAGFVATCAKLETTRINLTVDLAFVRNSIGSNSYVSDEIITSRAGVRVRVGHTDAEGRMVMSDLIAHMKERALASGQPEKARIMTCATLTGHVIRAYGYYAAAIENGPAQVAKVANRLRRNGHLVADPFEVSTLRRDDFNFVAPTSSREDVVQANGQPSTMTARGHQYPMAFLVIASGLDKHGMDAKPEARLAFTHLDIAGAAEEPVGGLALGKVTGAPVAALAATFLDA